MSTPSSTQVHSQFCAVNHESSSMLQLACLHHLAHPVYSAWNNRFSLEQPFDKPLTSPTIGKRYIQLSNTYISLGADFLAGEQPFDVPLTTYYGIRDRKISAAMVGGWQRFTTESVSCTAIDGHHLWPLDREAKQAWLSDIVAHLTRI